MKVRKVKVKVTQSCPTPCNPMDYRVHGILQARILKWVDFPFSSGFSQPRNWTQVSCIAGGFFTSWATREAQEYWSGYPIHSPGDLADPGIKLGSPALQADSLPAEPQGKHRGTEVKSNRFEIWNWTLEQALCASAFWQLCCPWGRCVSRKQQQFYCVYFQNLGLDGVCK